MSRKNAKRGTEAFSGVNPQGFGSDIRTPDPKSALEDKAKKDNTKI
ncbi:small, acid-soluble spore protein L [Bacillus pinisoli]|nr:small, acid-soluble spore protein L [Bacillus pinisoli]